MYTLIMSMVKEEASLMLFFSHNCRNNIDEEFNHRKGERKSRNNFDERFNYGSQKIKKTRHFQ